LPHSRHRRDLRAGKNAAAAYEISVLRARVDGAAVVYPMPKTCTATASCSLLRCRGERLRRLGQEGAGCGAGDQSSGSIMSRAVHRIFVLQDGSLVVNECAAAAQQRSLHHRCLRHQPVFATARAMARLPLGDTRQHSAT